MSITVRIDGLAETQQALRALPDSTAKNVLRRIMRERLKPMADTARRLAPVDRGSLRESIIIGTKLSRRQKAMHQREGDAVEMFMGPSNLAQASLQEFGTYKERAQPFMRPAWDQHKDELLQGIKDDLWREIEKAGDRLARKAARAASGG